MGLIYTFNSVIIVCSRLIVFHPFSISSFKTKRLIDAGQIQNEVCIIQNKADNWFYDLH